MPLTARQLTLLAVFFLLNGCASDQRPRSASELGRGDELSPGAALPAHQLQRSPNRIIGRILAVDLVQGIAVIGLPSALPPVAVPPGAELIARTDDLRETGRLRVSRYVRGPALGAEVISGQPATGNEVVWPIP